MKQYKLIKEYPGSPKLGYIFDKTTVGEEPYDVSICSLYYHPDLVKNQPEFWEEIIEKDYEILTYKNFITGEINFIGQRFPSNEGYREFNEKDLNATLSFKNEKIYSIHSVKRLLDGEIFTVGDKLDESSFSPNSRHNEGERYKYNGIITKIGIIKNYYDSTAGGYGKEYNNTLFFSADNRYGNFNVPLKKAKHKIKPLFTTADGVDIYEGDKYYIASKYMNISEAIQPRKCKPKELFVKQNDLLYFSTKEAAEEYILMNKPCLSYEDVIKIFDKTKTYQYNETNKSKILKLCQQKLDL